MWFLSYTWRRVVCINGAVVHRFWIAVNFNSVSNIYSDTVYMYFHIRYQYVASHHFMLNILNKTAKPYQNLLGKQAISFCHWHHVYLFTVCEWGLFFKLKWMIHSHRLDRRALSTAAWSGGEKPKSTLKCSSYTATAGWWVAIPSNWFTAMTSCVQVSLIWQIKIQTPSTRTADEFVACSISLGITNATCLRINQAFPKIKIFGRYIRNTLQPTETPWPSSKIEFYWYHLIRIC